MSLWRRRRRARPEPPEEPTAEPTDDRPAPAEVTAWREHRRYSSAALAELLGVHPRTVRRWERGETPVPAWLRHALAGLDAAGDP